MRICLLCPDNPLMNASRHVVELVGDELEQAGLEALLALTDELPELLLEEEPPELLEAVLELLLEEEPPELLEELLELLEEPPAGMTLTGVTWIEKAGSTVVVLPSLALMTMLAYLPVSGAAGVPESSPVVPSKLAQSGLFLMPRVRGVLVGFVSVGRKL
jgi:hypothetical protein